MLLTVLKSKLHRVKVTDANIDYVGSITIDENWMDASGIIEGEQVELPDEWLGSGGAWLVPHPEKSVIIRLGGKLREADLCSQFS